MLGLIIYWNNCLVSCGQFGNIKAFYDFATHEYRYGTKLLKKITLDGDSWEEFAQKIDLNKNMQNTWREATEEFLKKEVVIKTPGYFSKTHYAYGILLKDKFIGNELSSKKKWKTMNAVIETEKVLHTDNPQIHPQTQTEMATEINTNEVACQQCDLVFQENRGLCQYLNEKNIFHKNFNLQKTLFAKNTTYVYREGKSWNVAKNLDTSFFEKNQSLISVDDNHALLELNKIWTYDQNLVEEVAFATNCQQALEKKLTFSAKKCVLTKSSTIFFDFDIG